MSEIKLVACDIDGTLLHHGAKEIAPAVFEQIERIRNKGIIFCPASGRQYDSLRQLFAPVANEVSYMCENGAVIFGAGNPGPVLAKTVIGHEKAMQLCHQILSHVDCEILISGENTSYLITENAQYIRHIKEDVGNNVCVVECPEAISEDIVKISAFCAAGGDKYLSEFVHDWSDYLSVALGGVQWIDMTLANKGTGIKTICEKLGISLDEVMAIGDNYNDIPILSIVGHPYIMENAAQPLKDQFLNQCRRVEDTLAML